MLSTSFASRALKVVTGFGIDAFSFVNTTNVQLVSAKK